MSGNSNTAEMEEKIKHAQAEAARLVRIEYNKTNRGFFGKIKLKLIVENSRVTRGESTHKESHRAQK